MALFIVTVCHYNDLQIQNQSMLSSKKRGGEDMSSLLPALSYKHWTPSDAVWQKFLQGWCHITYKGKSCMSCSCEINAKSTEKGVWKAACRDKMSRVSPCGSLLSKETRACSPSSQSLFLSNLSSSSCVGSNGNSIIPPLWMKLHSARTGFKVYQVLYAKVPQCKLLIYGPYPFTSHLILFNGYFLC